jgi:hypothetical protein
MGVGLDELADEQSADFSSRTVNRGGTIAANSDASASTNSSPTATIEPCVSMSDNVSLAPVVVKNDS